MATNNRISVTGSMDPYIVTQNSLRVYQSDTSVHTKSLKQVTRYIILASILWIVIGTTIFIRNYQKSKLLSKHSVTKYCCDCWNLAQENGQNAYKIDWSYCVDDCTCSTCQNAVNSTSGIIGKSCDEIEDITNIDFEKQDKKDNIKDSADTGCLKWLSTTSLNGILSKSYWIYGIIGIIISIVQILILCLYLSIYKSIYVGVSLFIHTIVSLEICYYCIFKCYQYYPIYSSSESDDMDSEQFVCYVDILKIDEEDSINYFVITSMIFHIAIQWIFSCIKCCLKKCKFGAIFYRYWTLFISVLTILCILWALAIYTLITKQIIREMDKLNNEELRGLIISTIAIFIQLILIFCFPFCWTVTKQVSQSWKCCNCCCLPSSSDHDNVVPYYKTVRESITETNDKSVELLAQTQNN